MQPVTPQFNELWNAARLRNKTLALARQRPAVTDWVILSPHTFILKEPKDPNTLYFYCSGFQ